MRLKAVTLEWFRGAADCIAMEPDCRSMVVYGSNGSGKSSFVDAIEYVLNAGRIGHLAHEYSGKHLKNALPNTHKPNAAKTEVAIKLSDDSEVKTEIREDGSTNTSGSIGLWDYRRTVLRQEEVVAFIHDTKGGKYSALLPLFGLHKMEVAAENLRQLAKNIESLTALEQSKIAMVQTKAKRKASFGTATDEEVFKKIEDLHSKYCGEKGLVIGALNQCADLTASLDARIVGLSADERRHVSLRAVAEIHLKSCVDAVRTASLKFAGSVDPLVAQKLAVLESSQALVAKLTSDGEVECPACGKNILVADFRQHVASELEHLREIRNTFNLRKLALGGLCDAVRSLQITLDAPDAKNWKHDIRDETLVECLKHLDGLDVQKLRAFCDDAELREIETTLIPIIEAATQASVQTPPKVQHLLDEKVVVDAAKAIIQGGEEASRIENAEAIISVVMGLERTTRQEIRLHSEAVIAEISDDIRDMWSILHPGEPIENVHLYLPKDSDKAIDIGLKFHGKELESPRLTLSEGYRNSLGLCIFLSMAKRETGNDRPVILDDVVVSLDRNHRGMIVELLEKIFGERQVIILTHDRDWYTELRQQLSASSWIFKVLLPYETPEIGIRWSHKTTTFDDARAQLADRPDSAGNDARKIMDFELSVAAERLRIKFPYLRFDKNDRRSAHEFLERLIGDGVKCFQKRDGTSHAAYEDAVKSFRAADQLLVTWGNQGSHTFDVVQSEASKLIQTCEAVLEVLKCKSCGKPVWFADAKGPELVQCECGEIRWRYGKA